MLVKIWTDSFIITGEIDTLRDERLTDYIRENKDFIAVTQVKVLYFSFLFVIINLLQLLYPFHLKLSSVGGGINEPKYVL